jgi:hypothetical protein
LNELLKREVISFLQPVLQPVAELPGLLIELLLPQRVL